MKMAATTTTSYFLETADEAASSKQGAAIALQTFNVVQLNLQINPLPHPSAQHNTNQSRNKIGEN